MTDEDPVSERRIDPFERLEPVLLCGGEGEVPGGFQAGDGVK